MWQMRKRIDKLRCLHSTNITSTKSNNMCCFVRLAFHCQETFASQTPDTYQKTNTS